MKGPAAMKIVGVRLTRVAVPLRFAFVSSRGTRREYVKTIVRLETEAGIAGIGETDGAPAVHDEACRLASGLLGRDVLDADGIRSRLRLDDRGGRRQAHEWIAAGGVEMACWDILGKHRRQPLYALLGRKRRSAVPMVAEMSAAPLPPDAPAAEVEAFFADPKNAERAAENAERAVRSSGYGAVKLKSVGRDPDWDVRTASALQEALGRGFPMRIDPNGAYGVDTAIETCRRLDPLGLQWFEDPTSGLDGLRRVRAAVKTPVATNMFVIQFHHLEPARRIGAVDVVGVDFFNWGGIANARHMLEACAAHGFRVFWHCSHDLGVTTAATLHLAATAAELASGVDTCLYQQDADVIEGGGFRVADGQLRVPEGPGLGVALDESAVSKFSIGEFEKRL